MIDKVKLLPVPDTGQLYDFQKMVLGQVAGMFGLPYAAFDARKLPFDPQAFRHPLPSDPHVQSIRTLSDRILKRVIEQDARERERRAAFYIIGYDPQMLLEHKP